MNMQTNESPDTVLPSRENEKEAQDQVNNIDFDPAKWQNVLTKQIKQIIIEKGPVDIPNNFSFPTDKNV